MFVVTNDSKGYRICIKSRTSLLVSKHTYFMKMLLSPSPPCNP